jgi:hypothetical protein
VDVHRRSKFWKAFLRWRSHASRWTQGKCYCATNVDLNISVVLDKATNVRSASISCASFTEAGIRNAAELRMVPWTV